MEFAGRWSLLRTPEDSELPAPGLGQRQGIIPLTDNGREASRSPEIGAGSFSLNVQPESDGAAYKPSRENAVEKLARTLLRRYGVVFRRLLERESLAVSWHELGRVFRRLEARGEIRGGYFVGGVGGEQFALSEAVGALRATRKAAPVRELLVVSGADPLNLAGILTPGKRVASLGSNRILLRDGVPIAALEGREVVNLEPQPKEPEDTIQRILRIGTMPAALRPYYA